MRKHHLLKIATAFILFSALAQRGDAQTLDQSQLNFNTNVHADRTNTAAQTFTPSVGGTLSRLDLFLLNSVDGQALHIAIADTLGGLPNHILGTTTVTPDRPSWSWYSVGLNIPLNAGSLYAIELSGPGVTFGVLLGGDTHDDYSGGMTLVENPSGGGWHSDPSVPDLTFQTWMIAPVPEPSIFGLIGGGFLCLAVMRRVGKRA